MTISLHNKKFKSLSNSETGEVDNRTIFHYRQKNNIIWATYEGGQVLFGTLSGRIDNDKLIFTYQHQNMKGEFMTGKCTSTCRSVSGKLQLHEEWQWTCNDHSKGHSILEEI